MSLWFEHYTYNIPGVPQVGVCPHKKAHCNDLHRHFPRVNNEEDEIDWIDVIGDQIDLLIEGKEQTVDHNDEEDEAVEPGIHRDNLNDLITEWIRYR